MYSFLGNAERRIPKSARDEKLRELHLTSIGPVVVYGLQVAAL